MDHITSAVETLSIEVINTWEQPTSLSEMEQQIRRFLLWLGNIMLSLWLRQEKSQRAPKTTVCPYCQGQARYHSQRQGRLHTMFGRVSYRRAYYTCDICHQGHYPLDERLGLRPNQMSAEVERLAGMVGVQTAFDKGSRLFEELTLVSLSDHSLDKSAQAYGQAVEDMEANWQAEAADHELQLQRKRDARPVLRLYGAMDGALMHIRGDLA